MVKDKKKTMKRIKESIGEAEYKKLLIYIRGVDNIKDNTRKNLLRTFTILFYTGLRLNEIQVLRIGDIEKLIESGSVVIETSKTSRERKLFASDSFIKALEPLFDLEEDKEHKVIQKSNCARSGIGIDTYLKLVNKTIKEALGKGYSSHSFRQGMVTEMVEKGVDIKVISEFIGHSSIQTTYRYVKPTKAMIEKALIR